MTISAEWFTAIFTAIGSFVVLGGVIGWFIRLERRMGRYLSREEHRIICEDHKMEVLNKLTHMEATLETRETYSVNYREQMLEKVTMLRIDIARIQERADILELLKKHGVLPARTQA